MPVPVLEAIPSGGRVLAEVQTSSNFCMKAATCRWKACTAAVGSSATVCHRFTSCRTCNKCASRDPEGSGIRSALRLCRQVNGCKTSAGLRVTKSSGYPKY